MERTKYPKRLPDAIQLSPKTEFTQIRNTILRDQNTSFKAKGLLCLLLSNESGKWASYQQTIQKFGKEGAEAIRSGLKELEKAGFLLRLHYVDKETKRRRGSFWAYTDYPGQFEIEGQLQFLEENDLEIQGKDSKQLVADILNNNMENPDMENPDMGNPKLDNQRLKILNNKNIKLKKENIYTENCKKVYEHWISIASHINKAKYTENLEKKISAKLKKYPLNKLLQAISNYVQVYDNNNFYYTHIFSLYGFVDQGNGAPRFVEGLDEKYDGDLWRDYKNNHHKGAPGQTQEGISGNEALSPQKLLKQHFPNENLRKAFLNNCFAPAKQRIPNLNGKTERTELARELTELHLGIREKQKHVPENFFQLYPEYGSVSLIGTYISNLPDTPWPEWRQRRLFDINAGWFQNFCNTYANECTDKAIHPLTGKTLKGNN